MQYPHLILPVDSAQPDVAFATSFNGTASGSESSIFNFDVPQSAAGKTCNLVFPFPKQSQLETSAYTFSGNGGVSFAYLSNPAQQGKTTYNTMPKIKQDLGVWTMAPGNAYTVATMACPAGQAVAFSMAPKGDTCLNYFQDYNPCREYNVTQAYCDDANLTCSDRPLHDRCLSDLWPHGSTWQHLARVVSQTPNICEATGASAQFDLLRLLRHPGIRTATAWRSATGRSTAMVVSSCTMEVVGGLPLYLLRFSVRL